MAASAKYGGSAKKGISGRLRYIPGPAAEPVAQSAPGESAKTAGTVSGNAGGSKGGDAGMMVRQSLLDLLSIQMKCEYLSDLRFLPQKQGWHLAQKLERQTSRKGKARDWNDALTYLKGASPQATEQAAKEQLIKLRQ